jgi:hypothetical protein
MPKAREIRAHAMKMLSEFETFHCAKRFPRTLHYQADRVLCGEGCTHHPWTKDTTAAKASDGVF